MKRTASPMAILAVVISIAFREPLAVLLAAAWGVSLLIAGTIAVVARSGSETAWAVTPRLAEETTYFWLARAHDGALDGPATAPQRIRVNVMNEEHERIREQENTEEDVTLESLNRQLTEMKQLLEQQSR